MSLYGSTQVIKYQFIIPCIILFSMDSIRFYVFKKILKHFSIRFFYFTFSHGYSKLFLINIKIKDHSENFPSMDFWLAQLIYILRGSYKEQVYFQIFQWFQRNRLLKDSSHKVLVDQIIFLLSLFPLGLVVLEKQINLRWQCCHQFGSVEP
jgi:hypothetical protein